MLRHSFILLLAVLPLSLFARAHSLLPPDSMETKDDYPVILHQRLDSLLQDEWLQQSQLGLYVYDLTSDTVLYASGHRQYLRPASCQKVITAVAAINALGGDYRLSTSLYLQPSDSTVSIRAGFDPLFGADDMRAFAHAIRTAGITAIRRPIIIDRSLKDTLQAGWGWCWDDDNPSLSALLYNGKDTFCHHFLRLLADEGISTDSITFAYATIPEALTPVVIRSHTLQQVLIPMLKESDNQMAEAIFYHLAAHCRHPYAGRREATHAISNFLARTCPSEQRYQVADGSGLSLYNYTTPAILVATLRQAWQNPEIYGALLPALPVMGKDGTLRKRCRHSSAQGRVWAKTGTVDGVSTLSGYALAPNGHHLAFSIMNQGLLRTREGRAFQDKVCIALTTRLHASDIDPDVLPDAAANDGEDAADEEE